MSGEDSVNPQLFVSRLLLPLGYREFNLRVLFFDHATQMYFQFPIGELNARLLAPASSACVTDTD